MEIRELLKSYRLKQKKTKKAWAGPIISSSFYARVEKGISRISAEDLLNLLDYNQISALEFFGKLKNEKPLVKDGDHKFTKLIIHAYYNDSKEDLQKIRQQILKSSLSNKNKEDSLLLADISIALVNNELASLDPKKIQLLKNRFFDIENINEESIYLYGNCMVWFDFTSNLMISKKVIKRFINTDNIQTQIHVLGIIINMLVLCIKESHYDDSTFFISNASKIIIIPENYYYHNVLNFFTSLIEDHYDHHEEHLSVCHTIIANFKINGLTKYSQELAGFLAANK